MLTDLPPFVHLSLHALVPTFLYCSALMLSDGVHSVRAIFDEQAARGVGAVRDNAVVQLEDYSVQGFPSRSVFSRLPCQINTESTTRMASSTVTVRGFDLVDESSSAPMTATAPLRRIGQPARMDLAPLPPSALPPTRSIQPLLPLSTGTTTSTFYSSGSSSEDEIDSVVPTSPSSPTHQHAPWKPRLPLELQAMIIKHCLASYRNDDKLERDRQKMKMREAASSAGGPSVEDAQAKKGRLVQAMKSLGEISKCGTQEKSMGRWNLVLVCKNVRLLLHFDRNVRLVESDSLPTPLSVRSGKNSVFQIYTVTSSSPTCRPTNCSQPSSARREARPCASGSSASSSATSLAHGSTRPRASGPCCPIWDRSRVSRCGSWIRSRDGMRA